jgi:sporulation protein YlmC with PRC-barrel domain
MMIKTFAAALMATTLLAAPALAEDTMHKTPTPPAAQNTNPATNAQSAQPSTAAQTAQQSDQWRTSKLVGLNVYNSNNEKIGDINELIMGKDGQIDLIVVGVGGFLGMGEKDVAVPFEALNLTQKNNKWYLTMNASKDELKSAPGFKYDRNTTTWISDKSASNATPNRTARK